MKKLYRRGTAVHPSPPVISDHLAFLPATILTLAAALSNEDRELLAYLLSCSSGNFPGDRRNAQQTNAVGKGCDHPPSFNCNCFRCYTSYWVRWDSSPNRQLIHEIIDAFEDGLAQSKRDRNKRERKKRGGSITKGSGELNQPESSSNKDEFGESESVELEEMSIGSGEGDDGVDEIDLGGEEGIEKGSVRKLVGFLGEKFWSVWN